MEENLKMFQGLSEVELRHELQNSVIGVGIEESYIRRMMEHEFEAFKIEVGDLKTDVEITDRQIDELKALKKKQDKELKELLSCFGLDEETGEKYANVEQGFSAITVVKGNTVYYLEEVHGEFIVRKTREAQGHDQPNPENRQLTTDGNGQADKISSLCRRIHTSELAKAE